MTVPILAQASFSMETSEQPVVKYFADRFLQSGFTLHSIESGWMVFPASISVPESNAYKIIFTPGKPQNIRPYPDMRRFNVGVSDWCGKKTRPLLLFSAKLYNNSFVEKLTDDEVPTAYFIPLSATLKNGRERVTVNLRQFSLQIPEHVLAAQREKGFPYKVPAKSLRPVLVADANEKYRDALEALHRSSLKKPPKATL